MSPYTRDCHPSKIAGCPSSPLVPQLSSTVKTISVAELPLPAKKQLKVTKHSRAVGRSANLQILGTPERISSSVRVGESESQTRQRERLTCTWTQAPMGRIVGRARGLPAILPAARSGWIKLTSADAQNKIRLAWLREQNRGQVSSRLSRA